MVFLFFFDLHKVSNAAVAGVHICSLTCILPPPRERLILISQPLLRRDLQAKALPRLKQIEYQLEALTLIQKNKQHIERIGPKHLPPTQATIGLEKVLELKHVLSSSVQDCIPPFSKRPVITIV